MLPSTWADLRCNWLHPPNRYVVHRLRTGLNDQRKSSLHGWFADRPAHRNHQDLGHAHQGRSIVDEQGVRYEGIWQVSEDQDYSLEKRTTLDDLAAADERPAAHRSRDQGAAVLSHQENHPCRGHHAWVLRLAARWGPISGDSIQGEVRSRVVWLFQGYTSCHLE